MQPTAPPFPPSAADPTLPFSFASFMNDFRGWEGGGAGTAGAESRASEDATNHHEGGGHAALNEESDSAGGFGFLFNIGAPAAEGAEEKSPLQDLREEGGGDSFPFDFSSFFLQHQQAPEATRGGETDPAATSTTTTATERTAEEQGEAQRRAAAPVHAAGRASQTKSECTTTGVEEKTAAATVAANVRGLSLPHRAPQYSQNVAPPSSSSSLAPVRCPSASSRLSAASSATELSLAAALAAAASPVHRYASSTFVAAPLGRGEEKKAKDAHGGAPCQEENMEDEEQGGAGEAIAGDSGDPDKRNEEGDGMAVHPPAVAHEESNKENKNPVHDSSAVDARVAAAKRSASVVIAPSNAPLPTPAAPSKAPVSPPTTTIAAAPPARATHRPLPPPPRAPEASPARLVDDGSSASAVTARTDLTDLIADAERVCSRAAQVEAETTAEGQESGWSSKGGSGGAAASDAVFSAEAAQLLRQSSRLSEETAESSASFQSQTGDLLRLLGPHVGLAGLLGEGYAATPVVHLMPLLIDLLEELLQEDVEEPMDEIPGEEKDKERERQESEGHDECEETAASATCPLNAA